jgi:hypothetical protein
MRWQRARGLWTGNPMGRPRARLIGLPSTLCVFCATATASMEQGKATVST